jgi:hypothetical protein
MRWRSSFQEDHQTPRGGFGVSSFGGGQQATVQNCSRVLQPVSEKPASPYAKIFMTCEKSGFAPLKHVSLDGTKVEANDFSHKGMSYDGDARESC